MKHTVSLALLCGLLGAGLGLNPALARPKPQQPHFASPAQIVAAEVVFQQLAQRKGQWAAFRDTAAEDAVMFVPQPVVARTWLRAQKTNPAQPLTWQPHQVWLSCDGSLAVSYGAWQQGSGKQGYFTTVWQRQKKGDYKWVMDQGDDLSAALPSPEMIGSAVGVCIRGRKPDPATPPALPAGTRGGWSDDRTLSWAVTVDANCARSLTISLLRGAGQPMTPMLTRQVAAPMGADGKPSATCEAAA